MTTTLLTTASIWFHTLATIVLIGHHLLLASVYLPVFKTRFSGKALLDLLADVNAAIRKRIYAALGVFAVTGVYLMFVNESYLGIGQFSNIWSVMMLVKHILIMGMIGLIFLFNSALAKASQAEDEKPFARLNLLLQAITLCGVVVILLTALAQA